MTEHSTRMIAFPIVLLAAAVLTVSPYSAISIVGGALAIIAFLAFLWECQHSDEVGKR